MKKKFYQALYQAALNPHLSAAQFRVCVISAFEQRNEYTHEGYTAAFERFVQEAVYAYERKHFAKGAPVPPTLVKQLQPPSTPK